MDGGWNMGTLLDLDTLFEGCEMGPAPKPIWGLWFGGHCWRCSKNVFWEFRNLDDTSRQVRGLPMLHLNPSSTFKHWSIHVNDCCLWSVLVLRGCTCKRHLYSEAFAVEALNRIYSEISCIQVVGFPVLLRPLVKDTPKLGKVGWCRDY